MGYSKVIKESDHKVRLVHQLNPDGTPYAEDVTIETDESVDPGRLDYLARFDGQVVLVTVSVTAAGGSIEGMRFPEG